MALTESFSGDEDTQRKLANALVQALVQFGDDVALAGKIGVENVSPASHLKKFVIIWYSGRNSMFAKFENAAGNEVWINVEKVITVIEHGPSSIINLGGETVAVKMRPAQVIEMLSKH
jgi:hypothetical protein